MDAAINALHHCKNQWLIEFKDIVFAKNVRCARVYRQDDRVNILFQRLNTEVQNKARHLYSELPGATFDRLARYVNNIDQPTDGTLYATTDGRETTKTCDNDKRKEEVQATATNVLATRLEVSTNCTYCSTETTTSYQQGNKPTFSVFRINQPTNDIERQIFNNKTSWQTRKEKNENQTPTQQQNQTTFEKENTNSSGLESGNIYKICL